MPSAHIVRIDRKHVSYHFTNFWNPRKRLIVKVFRNVSGDEYRVQSRTVRGSTEVSEGATRGPEFLEYINFIARYWWAFALRHFMPSHSFISWPQYVRGRDRDTRGKGRQLIKHIILACNYDRVDASE